VGWPLLVITVFIVGTIYNTCINRNVSDQTWLKYWYIWVIVSLTVVSSITVWFIIGGFKDMIELFRRLKVAERDAGDDGTVTKDDDEDE